MATFLNNSRHLRLFDGRALALSYKIVRTKTSTSRVLSSTLGVGGHNELSEVKPFSEMPGPRGIYNLPLLGFFFHFKPFTNYTFADVPFLMGELKERYGPTFRILLETPTVIISKAEDIATVNKHEGKYPYRPSIRIFDVYYERTGKKPHLVSAQGEDWYNLRASVHKRLMKPSSLEPNFPVLNEISEDFIKLIASGGLAKDGFDDGPFLWFAIENVALIIFNRRLGYLTGDVGEDGKEFLKATVMSLDVIKKSLMGETFAYLIYEDKVYKEFVRAQDIIESFTRKFIQQGKRDLEKSERDGTYDPDNPTFFQSLVKDESVSDSTMERTLEALYGAGADSSANSVRSCFFQMAKNPDKQEILRKEIHRVLGRDKPVTYESLGQMHYLNAVLKECYRIAFPVNGGGLYRRLEKDLVLDGYNIPAGTNVMNFQPGTVRDGFDRPDEFIPERWMRNEKDHQKNTISGSDSVWAVRPFGMGPRMCLGRRVIETEILIVLAKTLQTHRIAIEPWSRDIRFNYSLFLKPERQIDFIITPL